MSARLCRLLLLFVASWGCGGGDSSSESAKRELPCSDVPLSDCPNTSGCLLVSGEALKVNAFTPCRHGFTPLACIDESSCAEMEHPYAKDLTHQPWKMTPSCLLERWIAVEPDGWVEQAGNGPLCERPRYENECPTFARRYDPARKCRGPLELVVCLEQGCGDTAIRLARDSEGDLWTVTTACTPLGWTTIENPTAEELAASARPHCK